MKMALVKVDRSQVIYNKIEILHSFKTKLQLIPSEYRWVYYGNGTVSDVLISDGYT